jgi:FMN phosphatase YigB (HAD superfamily)
MPDATSHAVRADQIAGLLDLAGADATTLSLDCFDTLLWRNTHAPRDVFAEIALAGGGMEPRMWAEGAARRTALSDRGTSEVSIEHIYRRLLPDADAETIAAAVAGECVLEARHCYGFAPVVALMRAARARGLRVIIVSDTYFSQAQLRALITAAAGAEVLALVDQVFVSSEYGVGKGDGLFRHVLDALQARPGDILHLGDNQRADQDAPSALGIVTAHFRQFDHAAEHRLRLEAIAGALVDPAVRITTPAYQPHRPAVSLRTDADPAYVLGHDAIGPVLHGFAQWVHAQADARSAAVGRPVRPLFLMRDGHLPLKVYEALYGSGTGAAGVEISRFTASAASFRDAAAVKNYLLDALDRVPIAVIARQLLLHGHEVARFAKLAPAEALVAFRRFVLEPATTRRILERSAAFAARLVAHVRAAGVAWGDAVMLVDLGYNGTVQNLVEPVLRDALELDVAGRYLLLREEQQTALDKAGFLDTRHYDFKMLHGLCGCIAVLEQLCTVAQGSAIDYSAEGIAVRRAADIKGGQSAIRDRVQTACLDFATHVEAGIHRPAASDGADARRQAAAAVLSRLLFMPVEAEVELFAAFDHDVNLGTQEVVRLLDPHASAAGLRRRGLSYINQTGRMYIPGELQRHGLPLNLSLFSASRFALDLRSSDFDVGAVQIPVILIGAHGQTVVDVAAHPTAEGYLRVAVAIGRGQLTAAVQLGAIAEWVQVDEVAFHSLETLEKVTAPPGVPAAFVVDAMEQAAPGLYRASDTGVVMVPPPAKAREPLVLVMIFRPVVWRARETLAQAAA